MTTPASSSTATQFDHALTCARAIWALHQHDFDEWRGSRDGEDALRHGAHAPVKYECRSCTTWMRRSDEPRRLAPSSYPRTSHESLCARPEQAGREGRGMIRRRVGAAGTSPLNTPYTQPIALLYPLPAYVPTARTARGAVPSTCIV
jgi:hypothetical protein